MSSDYPGGPSPQYSPRQSHYPQREAGRQSGYPGERDYSDMPASAAQPVRRQSANYPPNSRMRPASSSQRPRWMIPTIVVVAVLVVLGAVAGVVYAVGQSALQEPMNTANTFCNDMKAQKYSDAYKLLSSGYQARESAKNFADIGQIHDQLDGKVRQCGLAGVQGSAFNLNPQNASLNAQMTRNHSFTGAVALVKQNGAWKIDSLDDSLQGSDVGAYMTGTRFCQSLATQDYATVYAMFTPAYQQQIGSVDKYVNGLKQVFGGGQFQIAGCQSQVNTYTVTAQGADASFSGAFDIKVTTDAGAMTVQVPFKIAFAKISGAWKISDLEVVQSQG